jgi:hypothetical protein
VFGRARKTLGPLGISRLRVTKNLNCEGSEQLLEATVTWSHRRKERFFSFMGKRPVVANLL